MNPATIALIVSLVEEGIKVYPQLAADIQSIFSNRNPQPADWEALRAKVLSKSYQDYVAASALASGAATAETAAVGTPTAAQTPPISQTSASSPAPASSADPYLADGTKNPDFKE